MGGKTSRPAPRVSTLVPFIIIVGSNVVAIVTVTIQYTNILHEYTIYEHTKYVPNIEKLYFVSIYQFFLSVNNFLYLCCHDSNHLRQVVLWSPVEICSSSITY